MQTLGPCAHHDITAHDITTRVGRVGRFLATHGGLEEAAPRHAALDHPAERRGGRGDRRRGRVDRVLRAGRWGEPLELGLGRARSARCGENGSQAGWKVTKLLDINHVVGEAAQIHI